MLIGMIKILIPSIRYLILATCRSGSPISCNFMIHLFPHRLSAMAIVISSSNRASSKKSLSSVPCGLVSNGLHAKTPSLPSVSMLPEMSRSLKCKILVLVLLFIADTICVMESVLMCAPESRKFDWRAKHRSFLWSPNSNLTKFQDPNFYRTLIYGMTTIGLESSGVLLRLCFLIIGKGRSFFYPQK